jgi:hypothetical protein
VEVVAATFLTGVAAGRRRDTRATGGVRYARTPARPHARTARRPSYLRPAAPARLRCRPAGRGGERNALPSSAAVVRAVAFRIQHQELQR